MLLSFLATPQFIAGAAANLQQSAPSGGTIPPITYELTVLSAGNGTVTPTSGPYTEGTVVEMSAQPDSGWRFLGWGGALAGDVSPANVVMDTNKTVTAVFQLIEPERYALTTAADGSGVGTIDLTPAGGFYESGTQVTATASPRPGSIFTGWSGSCIGIESVCTLRMDAARSITATFALKAFVRYKLTTVTDGSGGGSINLSPAGGTYFPGTAVTLNAVADTDSRFVGWTGNGNSGRSDDAVNNSNLIKADDWIGVCGNNQTCTINMTRSKTVTATFAAGAPAPNTPPIATTDYASTAPGRAISIDLLANDSDADGHQLSIASVSQPGSDSPGDSFGFASGVVTQNRNNVIYKPAANFKGTTSFTYLLSDGRGGLDTGTATITVVREVTTIRVDGSGRKTQNFTSTIQANPEDLPPNSPLPNTPDNNANLLQYNVQTLIDIPSGAVTRVPSPDQPLEITFGWLDPTDITEQQTDAFPVGLESTLFNFIIDATVNGTLVQEYAFQVPIKIAVAYEDDLFEGLDESTAVVRYWDPFAQRWQSDGVFIIQHDSANNIVVIAASHLTQFAIFAELKVPAALDENGEPHYSLKPEVYLPLLR